MDPGRSDSDLAKQLRQVQRDRETSKRLLDEARRTQFRIMALGTLGSIVLISAALALVFRLVR